MNPIRGIVCACALLVATGSVRAADDDLFQECCHRKPVCCYAPPCGETTCRCGPIRRLLHRCCLLPAPCCPPCACYEPAPVCAPPPCSPGVLPGPSAFPPPSPPVLGQPTGSALGGSGYAPTPAVPQSAAPPAAGSSYRPERAIAPVATPPLTPPLPPRPVRLDRFVSDSKQDPPTEVVPASRRSPLPE